MVWLACVCAGIAADQGHQEEGKAKATIAQSYVRNLLLATLRSKWPTVNWRVVCFEKRQCVCMHMWKTLRTCPEFSLAYHSLPHRIVDQYFWLVSIFG